MSPTPLLDNNNPKRGVSVYYYQNSHDTALRFNSAHSLWVVPLEMLRQCLDLPVSIAQAEPPESCG